MSSAAKAFIDGYRQVGTSTDPTFDLAPVPGLGEEQQLALTTSKELFIVTVVLDVIITALLFTLVRSASTWKGYPLNFANVFRLLSEGHTKERWGCWKRGFKRNCVSVLQACRSQSSILAPAPLVIFSDFFLTHYILFHEAWDWGLGYRRGADVICQDSEDCVLDNRTAVVKWSGSCSSSSPCYSSFFINYLVYAW